MKVKILLNNPSNEIIIKGSRFISEVFSVSSQQEARDRLHEQKLRYSDATHVCHCFIAGLKAETCGMSDDGEPSGTAGRPMLDILKGSGITNILVTVTRYFGGTLLETGGLVKAYGDSSYEENLLARTEFLLYARQKNILNVPVLLLFATGHCMKISSERLQMRSILLI